MGVKEESTWDRGIEWPPTEDAGQGRREEWGSATGRQPGTEADKCEQRVAVSTQHPAPGWPLW